MNETGPTAGDASTGPIRARPSAPPPRGATGPGPSGAAALMALGALGVVYGDIGTSPIYALREAFAVVGRPTEASVLGVASLVVWTLLSVVGLKYLLVVMRAEDHGEGGIIALEALATRGSTRPRRVLGALSLIGLFGTALLYGDGMITPAISVLSAVEGIGVAVPSLERSAVPLAGLVLTGLFAVQRGGTARIGALFGPVMVVWFGFLALTGVLQILQVPSVLRALSPTYGLAYLASGGTVPLLVLGSVFLVATGSEALYADMGHFGRRPIAASFVAVVLPALLLQYLGQAALLLRDPAAAEQLFYRMVPGWALAPVVVLTTAATVIASQALISGAFSLTAQAVQLGYLPRLRVIHTSEREIGQVYVPIVNWGLYAAAVGLVVGFGSSTRLADAYGVAVVLTMVITTVLFYVVAVDRLGWSLRRARLLCAGLLVVDLAFLVANLDKVPSGGWFPLVVGGLLLLVMTTWRAGRRLVAASDPGGRLPVATLVRQLERDRVPRVPGTAVHLTRRSDAVPISVLADLRSHHVLHERVVLLTVEIVRSARVPHSRRDTVEVLGHGFVRIVLRFGFAEEPDVVEALRGIVDRRFALVEEETVYVLGSDLVRATPGSGMALWRERLFVVMQRNSAAASAHFRLPNDRVLVLGRRVDI